jgi:flagellar hook-length control protein FliK
MADSQDSFEPMPVVSMAMAGMVAGEVAPETAPSAESVQVEGGNIEAVPVKTSATAQETEPVKPASVEVVLNSGIVKKNTEEAPAEKNSVEEMPKKADSAATPEITPISTKTAAHPPDLMSEKKKPVPSNAAAENNPAVQSHAFSPSKAKPEIMALSAPEVKPIKISEIPASTPRQATSKEVPTVAVLAGSSTVAPVSGIGSEVISVPAGQQIAVAVRSGMEQGEPRVVIRLDPPDLGEVSISISSRGSGVQAVVRVEHPETLRRLEQETPGLMQRLSDAGIQVRRVELSLNNGSLSSDTSSGSMLRDQGNSSWQGQGQAFGSQRFGSGHLAEADSSSADGLPETLSYVTGDNQLNIWI